MTYPLRTDLKTTLNQSGEIDLIRAKSDLLRPQVWDALLEGCAAATNLAVALTDDSGRIVSRIINPRPTWSLLRARKPARPGECAFCLRSIEFKSCAGHLDRSTDRPATDDYAGLVHFTVPLKVDKICVGTLLAGQVFTQYPDQLALERISREFGISSEELRRVSRNEVPSSRKALKVYADLLESFANTHLSAESHNLLDVRRLTEMTRLRDLLATRTKELIEADRRKDEFLANLSHELRTPLTAILGWTRLMRGHSLDSAQTEKAVEVIDRNAVTQLSLIEDLLEVSRITMGKVHVDIRPIEFTAVITAAVDAIRPTADMKQISLHVALDTAASAIMGDPERLQQVVWNLLANAVKFTPARGRIDVRLERISGDSRLVVTDNGEGIDRGFINSVFDRFLQADASTARKHGGLGLGLAIVRKLVELHGGRVLASSAGKGLGATFTVFLPARD